ncbi:MAG: hypothetical protein KDB57_05115 [Solirubrobacterales bacterium]|nr:hypothetical protein [Solirubrobacterales bacterium]
MMELSKKELAEAKKQARRLRISNIRRRVATGAVMLVALFSGLALFRSIDQQAASTGTTTIAATTAPVSTGDEETDVSSVIGAAIVDQAVSVFGDDDDDEDEDDGGSILNVVTGSDPAPMTSSQS